jgi:Plasmid pRiA4b ORF-3-like protein
MATSNAYDPIATSPTLHSTEDNIAVLRIELVDIEPLIWRRVAVRASINLPVLHSVIQATMGWLDNHLWEFAIKHRRYRLPIADDPDWNRRITDATGVKLIELLASGATEISYLYDMGDNWQHRIIVEKLKPAEAAALYPQFLGGERRCPPEDCGGFPGYYEFLGNITRKQSKKRKAALDWYGGPYNPDDIDEQQIIAKLEKHG